MGSWGVSDVSPEVDDPVISVSLEVSDADEAVVSDDVADVSDVEGLVSGVVSVDSMMIAVDSDVPDGADDSNTLVSFEVSVTLDAPGIKLHAISCRLYRTHKRSPVYLNILRI